jgi:predicted NodU family carbamoyl transferase
MNLTHTVQPASRDDYDRITEVWEAAVRATHHFLTEDDVAYFRPLVRNTYLDLVNLTCVRDDGGQVIGFAGVADNKLEMLFVHPAWHGRGVGRRLLEHAVRAQGIAAGKVIGWYQGRMEYGARALGQRSILADPRIASMKDRVNSVVKFREGFRPFAPSALRERADEFFEGIYDCPFMTSTFTVRPSVRDRIPAVTHVDGTARVQTVSKEISPLYHRLISEVDRRTGVPVVLNTSFNIKGQPIVENPNQAISTFYGSGLDMLVAGSFVLEKKH